MRTGPSGIGSIRSAGAPDSASASVVVLGSAERASPESWPDSSLIEPLSLATCRVPFFRFSFSSSSASWASRQSRSQSSSSVADSPSDGSSATTLAAGPCSVSVRDGSPPSCALSSRLPFGFTKRGLRLGCGVRFLPSRLSDIRLLGKRGRGAAQDHDHEDRSYREAHWP